MRITSPSVDLELSQHYRSGFYEPYEVYYFDIYLHDTSIRVGYTDLRVGHSEYLFYLGNIGYRIDEPWRGHHYARDAAGMVLDYARGMKIDYIMITCDPDNTPSRITLDRLGGECLGDFKVPAANPIYFEGARWKRVYRFDLTEPQG